MSAGADGGVGPTFIPCSRSTCHAGRSREQMRPRFSCPQGISVAVEGEGHLHLCLPGARPPAHGAPRDRPAVCTQHGQAAGREPGSRPNLSPADWSVERAGEEQGPPLCLVKGGSESRWERSRVTAALQSPAEAAPLETETPATASFPEASREPACLADEAGAGVGGPGCVKTTSCPSTQQAPRRQGRAGGPGRWAPVSCLLPSAKAQGSGCPVNGGAIGGCVCPCGDQRR